MARFYALIANGGKLVTPHVCSDVEQPGTGGAPRAQPGTRRAAQQINIDPAALDVVREGLYEATHACSAPRPASSAASRSRSPARPGTAEKVVDPGVRIARCSTSRGGAATGPYDKPEIVVCALIENGGHGGTAAAPAALKVFEQYFHAKAPARRRGDSD